MLPGPNQQFPKHPWKRTANTTLVIKNQPRPPAKNAALPRRPGSSSCLSQLRWDGKRKRHFEFGSLMWLNGRRFRRGPCPPLSFSRTRVQCAAQAPVKRRPSSGRWVQPMTARSGEAPRKQKKKQKKSAREQRETQAQVKSEAGPQVPYANRRQRRKTCLARSLNSTESDVLIAAAERLTCEDLVDGECGTEFYGFFRWAEKEGRTRVGEGGGGDGTPRVHVVGAGSEARNLRCVVRWRDASSKTVRRVYGDGSARKFLSCRR